jgi:two-component system phosphate regulon sensor histidine kinase PhoR
MIDSVIDVSLLERESVIINRKPVILQSFMDEIVVSFKGNCEAAGKNVLILAEYTIPDNYKHSLDQAQFTRAISNLLANSVKYCEREPLISIRVLLNHVLQIVIEDNGIGIKEEHQINVFNKFYRAGNPANVKGLGLGLYIVKRIVENHDGTIRIDSEWGKGTTVTITLPK